MEKHKIEMIKIIDAELPKCNEHFKFEFRNYKSETNLENELQSDDRVSKIGMFSQFDASESGGNSLTPLQSSLVNGAVGFKR